VFIEGSACKVLSLRPSGALLQAHPRTRRETAKLTRPMVLAKAKPNGIERTTEATWDDLCSERQRNVMGSDAWSTKHYVTARLNAATLAHRTNDSTPSVRSKRFFDRGGAGESWSI